MKDQTDSQLLRAYAEHRSEPAFAELVRRHIDQLLPYVKTAEQQAALQKAIEMRNSVATPSAK